MTRPLTTTEAAEMVNFSTQTIARKCAAGEYPGAVKVFSRWRIPYAAFCREVEGEKEREQRTDLSVTAERKSNGQPYAPWEIELRRKWRSSG